MIYAKQIAPEYQESPLYAAPECFPVDLIATGNRHYIGHTTPAYDLIMASFDDMASTWEDADCTLIELLDAYGFEREDGKPWTTWQRHTWRQLMEGKLSAEDARVFLPALELLTGHRWAVKTIRGSCQSDWQNVIYRVDMWSPEALAAFEIEYFNMGSEWIVHDGDSIPGGPDDIQGWSIYCYGWGDEKIKEEIANTAGASGPEDVTLYAFDEWAYAPQYREVV